MGWFVGAAVMPRWAMLLMLMAMHWLQGYGQQSAEWGDSILDWQSSAADIPVSVCCMPALCVTSPGLYG